MAIELRITSGARAGARETFDKSVVAIGRHPMNDLRLDAERDLDVSGRHAEIRVVGNTATLRDVGSSNGTKVNGQPLVGERALFDGDIVALGGSAGATFEFRFAADAAAAVTTPPATSAAPPTPIPDTDPRQRVAPRRDTTARIAEAVEAQTGKMRRLIYVFGAAVVAIGLGLAWMSNRNSAESRATIETLLKELQDQNTAIAQLRSNTSATGLTNEVGRIKRERDSLLTVLKSGGDKNSVSARIAELNAQQRAAGAVSNVDYEKIAAANTRAVAFIVVQHGDVVEGGTGFGVTKDGLVVTNKHVVLDPAGAPAPKIAIQFHGAKRWLPAKVVKISSTDDLAFLRIDAPGPFPAVEGLSPSGGVRPGAPIAIVGYPLGNETAGMGGSIDTLTARASLTVGTISKSVPEILQIDAYVAHGSSGSPVFDQRGLVVGVVYGGPTEAAGRIVYSVPSDRLIAQLPGEAAGMVKR